MAKSPGRPPIQVDWDQVRALIRIQCTEIEVCSVMNLNDEMTLARLIKRDHKMPMHVFFKKERAHGNFSIRRAQWDLAVKQQDGPMLRWLGKNILGQSERLSIDQNDVTKNLIAGSTTKVIVHIVVKNTQGVVTSTEIARNWYDHEPRGSASQPDEQGVFNPGGSEAAPIEVEGQEVSGRDETTGYND